LDYNFHSNSHIFEAKQAIGESTPISDLKSVLSTRESEAKNAQTDNPKQDAYVQVLNISVYSETELHVHHDEGFADREVISEIEKSCWQTGKQFAFSKPELLQFSGIMIS
jgi:hypothetical protein